MNRETVVTVVIVLLCWPLIESLIGLVISAILGIGYLIFMGIKKLFSTRISITIKTDKKED